MLFSAAKVRNNPQNAKENVGNCGFFQKIHYHPTFFDFHQQKGLFANTVPKKSLPDEKNAVPLHRQNQTQGCD